MKYHTLLLDIDGTLLDFKKSQDEALKTAFARHNYPMTPEVLARYEALNQMLWKQYEKGEISRDTVIYTRFGKLFDAIGIDGDGVAFEDEYRELLGDGAFLLPGALELTKYLSKRYTLYVVTNGTTDTQLRRLHATGLDVYMKDIFISGELGSPKPQKEFFDACFARMGEVDKSGMLIIGDTLSSDIKGGNNAGIDTCWYNPAHTPLEEGISVTMEVHSFEEIYDIL